LWSGDKTELSGISGQLEKIAENETQGTLVQRLLIPRIRGRTRKQGSVNTKLRVIR